MIDHENAGVYNVIRGHFDEQAEGMKKYILAMPSRTFKNAYYVSPNGDDTADGRSPETAWRTLAPVNALEDATQSTMQAVLFERGGLWRGGIIARSCTVYSSYGEGEKPCIYGSLQNYADEALWMPVEGRDNIWRLSLADWKGRTDGAFINVRSPDKNDAGNVVFIDKQGEVVMCGKKFGKDILENDFDYYHNLEDGNLYLRLSGGNPAAQYPQIEIVPRYCAIHCPEHSHHIIIDNLCIRYANFGISGSNTANNITVRGCEIGWIGGCFHTPYVRFGNGIEFFGTCHDILVEDNWIYQCFDAGYSNQGWTPQDCWFRFKENDILVQNNLIEKCCYNLEVWVGHYDVMRDCYFRNNIMRFAGYQFERYNRFGGSLDVSSHVCMVYNAMPMPNPMLSVIVADNLMDYSYRHFVVMSYPNLNGKGAQFFHNRYAQKDGEETTAIHIWDITNDASVRYIHHRFHCQEELEEKVALFDIAPREVFFDGVADHE